MKKQILNVLAILTIGFAFTSCKDDVKQAETTEAEVVKNVDAETTYKVGNEAMIMWKANKVVGGHEGTINTSNGTVQLKNNALVGGNFTFDIASLKCTDLPADSKENTDLVDHLMGKDFFEVETYPKAKFEITNVNDNMISGNLTLKGITKNITFPAKVETEGNSLSITSDTFTIDRTEFGINYNSGKVMDAAKLGDYLIKDDVELKINVRADKA